MAMCSLALDRKGARLAFLRTFSWQFRVSAWQSSFFLIVRDFPHLRGINGKNHPPVSNHPINDVHGFHEP